MVKGIGVATESAISEFTPLPREVNRHSSLKKIAQHLLLKRYTNKLIDNPVKSRSCEFHFKDEYDEQKYYEFKSALLLL